MHGVIITEKYNHLSRCWSYLSKHKSISEMTVEDIINKYCGFEGDLVDFLIFKNTSQNLNVIETEYLNLSIANTHFQLLHVISIPDQMPNFLKDKMVFIGFDVGVCEEEKTIYSSIFNEVLFGSLNELTMYRYRLNDFLLFDNRNLAQEYFDLHNELSLQKKGVEDYEKMIVYEVWKYIPGEND